MVTNLLVVEDHPLMQMAIQTVLSHEENIIHVDTVYERDQIFEGIENNAIDMILLDLGLPNIDPIELVTELREKYPDVRILVYSGSTDHQQIARVLRLKVNGYLPKNSSIDELIVAIKKVREGGFYASGIATEALLTEFDDSPKNRARKRLSVLTRRERQIFDLLIQRVETADISRLLGISPSGIRSHTTHLMRKLNLDNQKELIVWAIEHDLLSDV